MVVFECSIPASDFVLAGALTAYPEVIVEYERVVPTNHAPLPFLWADADEVDAFAEAIAAADETRSVKRAATFDNGVLYRIDWTDGSEDLRSRLAGFEDAALLEAWGQGDRWQLKFRLSSRASLDELRSLFDELNVSFDVVRLYEMTNPKVGQYNLSEKQRAGLLRALEMGYFEIPREATLEEVADSLGISAKSLSERLRRGLVNLLTNSITIGTPSGVGIPDQ